jgi:hypothetical protein
MKVKADIHSVHCLLEHKHLNRAANHQLLLTQSSVPTSPITPPVVVSVYGYPQFWGDIPYTAAHFRSRSQQDSGDLIEKFCIFNAHNFSHTKSLPELYAILNT